MMKDINPHKLQTVIEGTVKSYDEVVGKGLIAREGHDDVQVNRAALKDASVQTLKPGDGVRFQVVETAKGWFASAVFKLQAAD
ncbi:MAG: cold-shock protein [candidate division Zixibacteria bacterium]|nr:cold-shock protein [candidate division Zixibacteria bacterium]